MSHETHPHRKGVPRVVAGLLACATAMLTLVWLTAAPASAGGPTSVLIVNYDGSRASGALTGSGAYDDLAKALDVYTDPTGESRAAESFMGSQIRLTWMIHDVTPWRVDGVFVNGSDVWVSTTVSHDGSNLFTRNAVWHRPKDADLLVETLTTLGVIGDAPASGSPRVSAPAAPAPAAQPAGAAARPESAGTTGSPWWLTASAAAAALGVGVALGRSRARAASGQLLPGEAPGSPPRAGMPPPSRPSPVGFSPDEAARSR